MRARSTSRREAEERLRREHILVAAEKVFAGRPFEEASMQEIAREAGIGMNGLYRQFPSKQRLYDEIVLVRLKEIAGQIKEILSRADPAERLHAFAACHARFFLERPQFFPIFAGRRLARDWGLKTRVGKSFDRHIEEVDAQLDQAIEAAVKKGELKPLPIPLLKRTAIGIFNSVLADHLLRGGSLDAEACANEMHELFLQGAAAT
jgi:AcrR family transcriptional regulator